MAARLHPAPTKMPELVDLRRLNARDLEPLLQEEVSSWLEGLEWDFEKSADLVRRFVDLRALNGSAIVEGGTVTGYLYYVMEENKGLIGDLFVRGAYRTADHEFRLLESGLGAIIECPTVTRIESQLMMMSHEPGRPVPFPEYASTYERNFMRIDLLAHDLPEARTRRPVFLERWSDHYQDAAAHLIAAAYTGHIDSRINDQYRSSIGARRFLYNIVQYPGCGTFYRPASYAAFDSDGRLCGLSLASLVAPESGHITQICVSPAVHGMGIGYALLRASLNTLREMGCRCASLTVTAANHDAVSLYERVGFVTRRRFQAYVWEGW